MGFKELLKDSVTEVFTYRTTKLVKTNDKFLVTLHFIFMSLIATFALVSILLSHNYMLFELPALYVTTTYQEFGPDPVTSNVALAREIAQNATVDYCNTGYVNWRRGGKVFDDAYMTALECTAQHAPAEYVWPFDAGNGMTIGTFAEVHSVTRSCTITGRVDVRGGRVYGDSDVAASVHGGRRRLAEHAVRYSVPNSHWNS